MLCILFLVRVLPAYFYRSILFRAFTGLLPDIPTGRATFCDYHDAVASQCYLWIWTVWVVFIILVTITDVILTSVFFYSYFVWLVTTYVLKYILFHLCADSQVLVGRPLKCLLIFGFDFWKLLTEKYCLLNNCMAALHRIRSVWTMCTIRSTWMGYTF